MELMLVGSRPLTTATLFSGLGSRVLDIDATKLTYASPLDLAGMTAMAHWADRDGLRVRLLMPEDPEVAAHLHRMNIPELLPPNRQIVGPPSRRAQAVDRQTLLPVSRLNANTVNMLLADRLGPPVTEAYRGRSGSAGKRILQACSELLDNAAEHGSSSHDAFAAAQFYFGRTGRIAWFEFAVCDAGMGVPNHMRTNPDWRHLSRDEVAIEKALQRGVSGTAIPGRGNGLADAVEDSRIHGTVVLQIRSGHGEVTVIGTPTRSRVRELRGRRDGTAGTWAWLAHRLQQ